MSQVVLNVASPFAPVGPDSVGGAEQVLTRLDAALVRDGYESLVLACEGSQTQGIHIATPKPSSLIDETARRKTYAQYRAVLQKFFETWSAEVIHMHGTDFYEYLPPPGPPVLITLHLPVECYPPGIFELDRPRTWLHCVSAAQQRACPPCSYLLPEIPDGVPDDLFAPHHARRDYAITLGRIRPEKGFHLALEAAKQSRMPLVMAGEVSRNEAHENYFQREIVPRLGESRRFLGPIVLQRKRRLLSAARCLLCPSLAPETRSLAAMEALACGTPVIAFPNGALADIVEHGKTGFLVNNEKEMAEAIREVDSLGSDACRESARQRFSLRGAVEKYFALYHSLSGAGTEAFNAQHSTPDAPHREEVRVEAGGWQKP